MINLRFKTVGTERFESLIRAGGFSERAATTTTASSLFIF